MKKINGAMVCVFASVFLLLISRPLLANNSDATQRTRFSLNDHWQFKYFANDTATIPDPHAIQKDTDWQVVNVPHTWNINDAPTDTSTYRRGIGWYKKQFRLPGHLLNKRIFIYFEGANQVSHVFVNGQKVGEHIGGYTAFSFEITSFLRFNGSSNTNTIAVRVDNSFHKDIPPLSADFTFYGGIYRDVWLVATEPVHVSMTNFASSGVFISTPSVSAEKGDVHIRGAIDNQSAQKQEAVVVNTVYDPTGKQVARAQSTLEIAAGGRGAFVQSEISITKPSLWSPSSPNLYSVKTQIFANGRPVDEVTNPLGFRWFHLDADSGFYLNGKTLRLIGTNRHQDYAGLGNALPDRLHVRDLQMIKDAGFNFLRLAHYPQDPAVLHTADRLGLIIWEEIPIVNYVTRSSAFAKNSANMLREMLHQHYNHPSIIFWGYMNEVFLHDADGNRNPDMNFPEDYLAWTANLAEELNSLIKKIDPARLTVMAAHHSDLYDKAGLTAITDAMGFNLYQGWYSSKFEHFGAFLDGMHQEYPERKIIISEYGAGSDERIHSDSPVRFDFSTEYQQKYHESYLQQIRDRDYLIATAVWAQNDFGSDRRMDTKAKLNQKGLQYFDRRPKDVYFFYQAALSDKPVVRIASHDWATRYTPSDGANSYPFKVYSNLPKLDIVVDTILFQTYEMDSSHILNFDLPLEPGRHSIEARGRLGKTVCTDHISVEIVDNDSNSQYPEIAVNIGSAGQFIDATGLVWQAERPYAENTFGYKGGKPRPIYGSESVLGTASDPLYQTFRQGILSCSFQVPQGIYEIELCFAEFEHRAVGERVMDVFINGNPVWEGLDLVKDYGYLQAVNRKFEVKSENSKGIEITFVTKNGKTILNAVCVRKK